MRHPIPLFALAFLFLPACSLTPKPKAAVADPKCLAAALATMCDVDHLAGITPEADPLGTGAKRTAWITEKVVEPDIIELRVLLSVKGAAEQGQMLHARAKEAGLASCALADSLEKSDLGGITP